MMVITFPMSECIIWPHRHQFNNRTYSKYIFLVWNVSECDNFQKAKNKNLRVNYYKSYLKIYHEAGWD